MKDELGRMSCHVLQCHLILARCLVHPHLQVLWFPSTFAVLLNGAAASQQGGSTITATSALMLPSSSSSALVNGEVHQTGGSSLSATDGSEGEREDGMEVARDWLGTALLLAPRHAEALIEVREE